MTDEELIEWLRLHGSPRDMAAADRIEALGREKTYLLDRAMEQDDRTEAAEARLAKAVDALRATTASIEHADMSDGVCCCGDNMDGHADPMSCGHSPTDMGEYYAHKAVEMARAVLAEIGGEG